MNNSTVKATYDDPDPTSALFLSIWYVIVCVLGIPLNIFIVVATVNVQEIRAVSSNMFIGSLALSDALPLLFLSLHLPYILTSDETLCKVTGFGVSIFVVLSSCMPSFLALNRYAVVCRQREKLAQYLCRAFSRKGTCGMISLFWSFEIICQLPFIIFDTLGLHSTGLCGTIKASVNDVVFRVYYYCGVLGFIGFCYFLLIVFHRKISSWVKTMSAQLSLSTETKQTIRETKNALLLTKWVTVVPLTLSPPGFLIALLFEFNSKIVSVGSARLISSPYPLIPLLNAIITLKFTPPYKLALKKACDRTKFTSVLFSWLIEGRWLNKVDVAQNNHTALFVARP